jgi:DNA polymerase-3 subunit epsilon
MTMPNHQFTCADGRYVCSICKWTWVNKPDSDCPGVPRFEWNTASDHLKTGRQLKKAHLKPGGPARGCIRYKSGWLWLYDGHEALPCKPATPAQLMALERGRKFRHCAACGRDVERAWFNEKRKMCFECIRAAERSALKADRDEAIRWAQQVLSMGIGDGVVLDTETTGLDETAEIVQIGVLALDGTILLNETVKPSGPIPAEATAVHGITDEMVADKPRFSDVFPILADLTRDKMVVTYNLFSATLQPGLGWQRR